MKSKEIEWKESADKDEVDCKKLRSWLICRIKLATFSMWESTDEMFKDDDERNNNEKRW